jgi:hypothetical protein
VERSIISRVFNQIGCKIENKVRGNGGDKVERNRYREREEDQGEC